MSARPTYGVRRCLALVISLLICGAAMNVAVSWACVWFTRKNQWVEVPPPPIKRDDGWLWKPSAGWPEQADEPECIRRPGVTLVRATHWRPRRTAYQMYSIRSGWPWQSMESRWESVPQQPPITSSFDFGIQVVEGSLFGYGVALPLRPIPAPFILNSVIYAVLLYLPWTLIRIMTRRSRISRGLCTRCKYPVRDLTTCPECGTLVPTDGTKTAKTAIL